MAQHPQLIDEMIPAPDGPPERFLDAILKPHTCYYQAFKGLFRDNVGGGLHGIAHITGGGIAGNLNRILPDHLDATIDAAKLRILPLFKRIAQLGNIPEADMLKTFNLGIGMTIVCTPASAEPIIHHLAQFGLKTYPIGHIIEGGSAVVHYENRVVL